MQQPNLPNWGFCIEPGCGDRFVRKSSSHRRCEYHSNVNKDMRNSSYEPRECLNCKKTFSPKHRTQKNCSKACVASWERIRDKLRCRSLPDINCEECGSKFGPFSKAQKICVNCTREKEFSVARIKPADRSDIPCFKCQHAALNKEATFGVECTIGWWMRCKPFMPTAKPLKVRDEALDSTA